MQSIKTSLPIIHLIDVIHPGLIDFSIVKQAEKITGLVRITIIGASQSGSHCFNSKNQCVQCNLKKYQCI